MTGLLRLAGDWALITGGGRRLGAATARALAGEGVNCVLHYNTSEEDAHRLAEELRGLGVEVGLVRGDLSRPGVPERVWAEASACSGGIGILINSASTFPEESLAELNETTLGPNLAVNTLAPFVLAREFAASGRPGAVVNFLDTMIRDYDRRHVPYHLSKKLLHHLTRMMAVEYAPGLRVNAVAPGLVLPPEGKGLDYLESLKDSNPLRAYGSAEQVAHAVIFLLQNTFVTGQVIYIDGGRNLRGNMYD